ncbi:MAG: energy-coupled thiamine transporter ThiT [Defluviitaleaceae bacterium]|nr:energy-coupled thiamine transporter ThiT [Defluviitaleaceae bacterium]
MAFFEQFASLINTDLGRFITLLIAALLFIVVVGRFFKKAKFTTATLAYVGLALAIAFVLSYFRLYQFPWGGSVTFMSMFFVVLIGLWFGPTVGLVSAFAYGLLQLAQNPMIFYPLQLILDYPLAFGALGLAGFFRKMKGGMYIGFVVAVFGRWVFHTLSGYFFFSQWAWEGWNALPYAMAYNAIYLGAEMILTLVIISIPVMRHALDHVKNRVVTAGAATAR